MGSLVASEKKPGAPLLARPGYLKVTGVLGQQHCQVGDHLVLTQVDVRWSHLLRVYNYSKTTSFHIGASSHYTGPTADGPPRYR